MKTKASNKDSHNIQASTPIARNLQCLPMCHMKYSLINSEQSSDIYNNYNLTIKHREKVTDESKALKVLHQMKIIVKDNSVSDDGIGQVL
jgi:hypothetical protein